MNRSPRGSSNTSMAPGWKQTLLGWLACAACAACAAPAHAPVAPPPARPSVVDHERERKDEAALVVRAYAESHAELGTPRRPPTAAELAAAAALPDPPYASIDGTRWRGMSAAFRLSEVYEDRQQPAEGRAYVGG